MCGGKTRAGRVNRHRENSRKMKVVVEAGSIPAGTQKKGEKPMKKIISLTVLITLLFSGIAFSADRDYPPEVPPCPPEYQDGLKP